MSDKIERPPEPYSSDDNTDQWQEVLQWEIDRAEKAEAQAEENLQSASKWRVSCEEAEAELAESKEAFLAEHQECVDALSKLDDVEEELTKARKKAEEWRLNCAKIQAVGGYPAMMIANRDYERNRAQQLATRLKKLEQELKEQKEKMQEAIDKVEMQINANLKNNEWRRGIDDGLRWCLNKLREIQGQAKPNSAEEAKKDE